MERIEQPKADTGTLKRFYFSVSPSVGDEVDEVNEIAVVHPEGRWVRYEDALAALRAAQDWKESAMAALGRWHALGDALMPFAKVRLGMDIPTELTEQIPPLLAASPSPAPLRALVEQWDAMVRNANEEGPIPGDEIGYASRWTAVEMCRGELAALLPTDERGQQ